MKSNIAVILTCFNRKEKTIKCLEQLFACGHEVDVYLVDDNSKDGTSEAIRKIFPAVNIISGNGQLFWNRGMHLAWTKASIYPYAFYIWLNDDVLLYPNSISELLSCSTIKNHHAIISGVIETIDKDKIIYGGTDVNKNLINPNGDIVPITNMNGNFVLVPSSVFKILGNLDDKLHHDLGDVDYGYRAIAEGIGIYTTRIPIGSGELNDFCRVRLNKADFRSRFKRLYSPLGSPPKIDFYFRQKHFGILNAVIHFVFLHFLNVIPDWFNMLLFKQRYI